MGCFIFGTKPRFCDYRGQASQMELWKEDIDKNWHIPYNIYKVYKIKKVGSICQIIEKSGLKTMNLIMAGILVLDVVKTS